VTFVKPENGQKNMANFSLKEQNCLQKWSKTQLQLTKPDVSGAKYSKAVENLQSYPICNEGVDRARQ